MARDDMHVVMCKIIAYLYACMKKGIEPDEKVIRYDSDMIRINKNYWMHIMEMLSECGLVR